MPERRAVIGSPFAVVRDRSAQGDQLQQRRVRRRRSTRPTDNRERHKSNGGPRGREVGKLLLGTQRVSIVGPNHFVGWQGYDRLPIGEGIELIVAWHS